MRKLQNALIFFVTLAVVSTFVNTGYCQPIFNNISGHFSDGKVVALRGASLGSGPTVVLYDQFEGGTHGSAIPVSSPTKGSGWSAASSTPPLYSNVAHSGSGSMMISNNSKTLQFTKTFTPATEVFLSFWVRIPDGTYFPGATTARTIPKVSSWKMAWFMDGASGYNQDDNIWFLGWTGGSWHIGGNLPGAAWYPDNVRNGAWWTFDGWMRMTLWLQAGANPVADIGNSYVQVLTEGVGQTVEKSPHGTTKQIRNASPYDYVPAPLFNAGVGNGIHRYDRLGLPGYLVMPDPNTHPVYDDVYLAVGPNALSRIEVGDNEVYSSCKRLDLQTPVKWSETHILFDVRTPSFSDGEKAYLFVFDSHGIHSSIPVVIGTEYRSYKKLNNFTGKGEL